jgi:hypothetical protein
MNMLQYRILWAPTGSMIKAQPHFLSIMVLTGRGE